MKFTLEGFIYARSRNFNKNPFHTHQILIFLLIFNTPYSLQTYYNALSPSTPLDELLSVKVCYQSYSLNAIIVPNPSHVVIRNQGPFSSGRMIALMPLVGEL